MSSREARVTWHHTRGLSAAYSLTSVLQRSVDQGFHNQMYYSGDAAKLEGVTRVKAHAFGEGLVITIGTARNIQRTEDGMVVNHDGKPAPVVSVRGVPMFAFVYVRL